jgi:hypothetical protein
MGFTFCKPISWMVDFYQPSLSGVPRVHLHPKTLWGAGFAPTCDIPAIFGRRLTVRPTPLSYILTLQGAFGFAPTLFTTFKQ